MNKQSRYKGGEIPAASEWIYSWNDHVGRIMHTKVEESR